MPYKRRYRKRKTYRRRGRTTKRYFKRGRKYYKKKRISRSAYAKGRQQLLSVNTVKKLIKKGITVYAEPKCIIHGHSDFSGSTTNIYKTLVFLATNETGGTYPNTPSSLLDTANCFNYRLFNPTSTFEVGSGPNQVLGQQLFLRSYLLKCRIKWTLPASCLNVCIRWFLIQTKATYVQEDPVVNASIFKTEFWSPPERQFSAFRKNIGYKVIKRGIWRSPKGNLGNNGNRSQHMNYRTVKNCGPNQNATIEHTQSIYTIQENGCNLPHTIVDLYQDKTIYLKINKKLKTSTVPFDNMIHDGLGQKIPSAPFRWYLIMFKDGEPNGTPTPYNQIPSVAVACKSFTFFNDA